MGVPAQRKGNPSDHRRGERQEARRQAGQQLNWPHRQLTAGFQINCYLQNTCWLVVVFLFTAGLVTKASCDLHNPGEVVIPVTLNMRGAFQLVETHREKPHESKAQREE